MFPLRNWLLLLSSNFFLIQRDGTDAFTHPTPPVPFQVRSQAFPRSDHPIPARILDSTIALSSTQTSNPADELSDERKANLFQFLLRDLEVEGVPLLECDATQNATLQAALWTTMAELSECNDGGKVCLVFERIPMDTLRSLVDIFEGLKDHEKFLDHLPELRRFSIALVGKGIGPAILIETTNRTDTEKTLYESMKQNSAVPDEIRWTAAMKTFVARMTVRYGITLSAPRGNEALSAPAYRIVGSPDLCDILAGFWNSICEMHLMPDDQIMSSIFMSFPLSLGGPREQSNARFAAQASLISRLLLMFEGEGVFEVLYMHPFYDRDAMDPPNDRAHGHLPPSGWLRHAMRKICDDDLSDEDLALQNFQRRSPLPTVAINRISVSFCYCLGINPLVLSLTSCILVLVFHRRHLILQRIILKILVLLMNKQRPQVAYECTGRMQFDLCQLGKKS
jgi:hypothetical protein